MADTKRIVSSMVVPSALPLVLMQRRSTRGIVYYCPDGCLAGEALRGCNAPSRLMVINWLADNPVTGNAMLGT